MRSGTVPTHLCVGLGAAASLAQQELRYLLTIRQECASPALNLNRRTVAYNFFPSNAFLRLRRKKALLRVNDRGDGWKMCILALCRVCTCVRYARAGMFAVNLRRYGNTPQTITIHDLVEILLLCAAHATITFS